MLLNQAIEILAALHPQDMNIGQLIKHLHYDRLLVDLNEALTRQTFLEHENHLWDACQSCLTESNADNGECDTRTLGHWTTTASFDR